MNKEIMNNTEDLRINNKINKKEGIKSEKSQIINQVEKKSFFKKYIIYIISIIVIIFIAIAIIIPLALIKKDPKKYVEPSPLLQKSDDIEPDDPSDGLKKEFQILTKTGDLRKISVVQKSKEKTKLNDETFTSEITRKTNYDIYFKSEEEASEENKKYYSKMYTGVVSINSECTTEGSDDCEPQPLVDLTSIKTRNLQNLDSAHFEKIPIPICLFNITDNHVITTMACPESLPDNKMNEIILDLYFFRPPAIERADKIGDNITLTINKDEKTKFTKIHETNGGLCNIYNNWGSICTTEMNTTLDAEGNLVIYDEQAITVINYDEENSYNKDKVTNLIDVSKNIKRSDIEIYENSLNNLLPLIKPYMKNEIQFTQEEYDDLYKVTNYKHNSSNYTFSPDINLYEPKKTKNTFRNLKFNGGREDEHIKNANLFSSTITPIQINIDFKIKPGINSPEMGAYGSIIFDDKEIKYSSIEIDSVIQELIEKLSSISKAGNILASELYDKINGKLDNITKEISVQINSLDELIMYYDIYKVFNSTLIEYSYKKLPSEIVDISFKLVTELGRIFNNIRSETGNIKYNADILSNNIYDYIDELHDIIRKMLNNLGTLSNVLLTKNNTFTQITNYYLNNTSSSYVNIIEKMKNILDTYYKKEYEKVFPKMKEILDLLELNSNDTLKKELNSLEELYTNLKEKTVTINSISESQLQMVISNLENSYEYPNSIIQGIKRYITEIMNIKENGYFISDEDIKKFNNTFIDIISEAENISQKLDDVTIIDKVFDDIMIKFRENYIYTMKFMEEIKSGNFTLEEDVLNTTLFTLEEKNKTETELKNICDGIVTVIKRENDYYLQKIKDYFTIFLENYLDDLNNIIFDLNVLFSEETIKTISETFELSLNLSLQKLTNITNQNINLTKQYFDRYNYMLNNDKELKQLLQNYYLDPSIIYNPYYHPDTIHQKPLFDVINGKMRTTAYLTKYNSFMANFNYSEEYLSTQLKVDIINEYREIFNKLKDELQSIVNNKLSEKYPDFSEIDFFEKHVRTIDVLKSRIDKYFSSNIFEEKYTKIINENINSNLQLIKSTKNYINNNHNSIKQLSSITDYTNDMCISFKRKVCYGCTNCVSYTYFYDRFCFILNPYEYNYLEIKKINYESVQNFGEFINIFNNFNNKINGKIEEYNNILKTTLNLNITLIKQETLKLDITKNYLNPLKDWVGLILNQKFENVLLQAVYNYFQLNLETKLKYMFSDIFGRWRNMFETLEEDVSDNEDYIQYSFYEFSNMAEIYRTIIQTDYIENYFNSIIVLERSELNYTISYYYNYILKLLDKYYKYMIQKIPTNGIDYNYALLEIQNNFNSFSKNISQSELNILNIKNQLNILGVEETDFFKVKNILTKIVKNISDCLEDISDDIFMYEMIMDQGNEYSLVMRYYLENKELGKTIEKYYEPLDREEFIYLNLNKFKDIMLENWIFNSEDFVNILNNALYETNKEIRNDLAVELENYLLIIDNEITGFFNNIENIVNNLFLSQIKEITSAQKVYINNNTLEIINEFEAKIRIEAQRIKNNPGIYNLNVQNIENSIKDYKKYIYSKINISIFDLLDRFYENVNENIFLNCIKNKSDDYLDQAKNIMTSFGEYQLLNSSIKIGEVIYKLVEDLIGSYKIIFTKKIFIKYSEYYEKIKSSLNLQRINNIIDHHLDIIYENILLPELNIENNCTSIVCPLFDFNQDTKVNINNMIIQKTDIIKNVMLLLKQDNYEANYQCNIQFANSYVEILTPLCESLETFLSFEKGEQVSRINEFIQNAIKTNLDDFLNNVIPVYGNLFFERIIDYNINFKIVDLYENLHYGISKTLLYYHALKEIANIQNLPYDLKIRLYNLNNLDITVLNKVEDIKEFLEKKLSELITDLKDIAKNEYTIILQKDQIIKNSFSPNVLEKIDFNLENIMPDLEKIYQTSLEKYLKEKFMNAFSDVLDQKTNYMLAIFYEEKNKLKERLDDLFSSKDKIKILMR